VSAAAALIALAVGFGGVLFGALLARRNDRRSRTDELLAGAVNDAVEAISRVAASNSTDKKAQTEYGAALSRIAVHGTPPVVAAWRVFQDEANTGTVVGRKRLVAAIQATRAQLGHGQASGSDLGILLFGVGPPQVRD
jgi:hypothetical protein